MVYPQFLHTNIRLDLKNVADPNALAYLFQTLLISIWDLYSKPLIAVINSVS